MPIPAFRLAAGAAALALLSIQIHGAVEYWEGGSAYALSSQIAALCAIAVLPIMAVTAMHQRRGALGAGLMLTTLGFLVYTLPTTVDRSAALREAHESVTKQVKVAQFDREVARNALSGAITAMEAECASGKGPKCKGWMAVVEQRRERVREIEAQPLPVVEKGHGITVFAWLTGLPEQTLRYLSALGNAVGLDLGIAVLAAFAAHVPASREAQKPEPEPVKGQSNTSQITPSQNASLGERWIAQYVEENPDADPKEAYAEYQEALKGKGGKRMRLQTFKRKLEEMRA